MCFHISAFWLEIAYFGPKFNVFGANGVNAPPIRLCARYKLFYGDYDYHYYKLNKNK